MVATCLKTETVDCFETGGEHPLSPASQSIVSLCRARLNLDRELMLRVEGGSPLQSLVMAGVEEKEKETSLQS